MGPEDSQWFLGQLEHTLRNAVLDLKESQTPTRDQIAMASLSALAMNGGNVRQIAKNAYEFADAMIAARTHSLSRKTHDLACKPASRTASLTAINEAISALGYESIESTEVDDDVEEARAILLQARERVAGKPWPERRDNWANVQTYNAWHAAKADEQRKDGRQ